MRPIPTAAATAGEAADPCYGLRRCLRIGAILHAAVPALRSASGEISGSVRGPSIHAEGEAHFDEAALASVAKQESQLVGEERMPVAEGGGG
jgi:hypothetical protein